MIMARRFLRFFPALFGLSASFQRCAGVAALCLLSVASARAVTCITQAEMKEPERAALVAAVRALASRIQANDPNGVKAATIPSVANNFGGIASAIVCMRSDVQSFFA